MSGLEPLYVLPQVIPDLFINSERERKGGLTSERKRGEDGESSPLGGGMKGNCHSLPKSALAEGF